MIIFIKTKIRTILRNFLVVAKACKAVENNVRIVVLTNKFAIHK